MFHQTKHTPDGQPRWTQNITMDKAHAAMLLQLLAVMDYRGAFSGNYSEVFGQLIEGAYKRNHAGASFKTLAKAGDNHVKPWLDEMARLACLPAEYEGDPSGKEGEAPK